MHNQQSTIHSELKRANSPLYLSLYRAAYRKACGATWHPDTPALRQFIGVKVQAE